MLRLDPYTIPIYLREWPNKIHISAAKSKLVLQMNSITTREITHHNKHLFTYKAT
jgi:hypothetical protein